MRPFGDARAIDVLHALLFEMRLEFFLAKFKIPSPRNIKFLLLLAANTARPLPIVNELMCISCPK